MLIFTAVEYLSCDIITLLLTYVGPALNVAFYTLRIL